jgi:hypothetical protein
MRLQSCIYRTLKDYTDPIVVCFFLFPFSLYLKLGSIVFLSSNLQAHYALIHLLKLAVVHVLASWVFDCRDGGSYT